MPTRMWASWRCTQQGLHIQKGNDDPKLRDAEGAHRHNHFSFMASGTQLGEHSFLNGNGHLVRVRQ